MTSSDHRSGLERLATLTDPVRRGLYEHVAAQAEPVGRDAAAEATGITRRLAAFHLDRLVEAGLLSVSYRRLTGRTGPGAGRPAKLYARPPEEEVAVSVPPRDYELAARVFIRAADSLGRRAGAAVDEAAADIGRQLARDAPPGGVEALLRSAGYEPYRDGESLRLRNCPFHRLAQEHRTLVCTANLHLLRGAAGERAPHADVELVPTADECCVRIRVPASRSGD